MDTCIICKSETTSKMNDMPVCINCYKNRSDEVNIAFNRFMNNTKGWYYHAESDCYVSMTESEVINCFEDLIYLGPCIINDEELEAKVFHKAIINRNKILGGY